MGAALQGRAATVTLGARTRRWPSAVVLAGACSWPVVASAAALGGVTSGSVAAWAMASSTGSPVVIVWEDFDAANGSGISGTTTDGGGQTWFGSGGSWSISGNRARAGSLTNNLIVDAGTTEASVEVTLWRAGTSFDAGLTLNSNSAGTEFLDVEWVSSSNGSLELWRFNGGWQLIASVSNLYPGGVATAPTPMVLRLETDASAVRVYTDGTLQLNHTLSAGDQATFKSAGHEYFGIFSYGDTTTLFDDFHIDT